MTKPFIVRSSRQLKVIASPNREAIVDAVGLIGACSIPELARVLRRSRHSLYYHVKALRDAGLLVESHRHGEGTRSTGVYDLPGRPFSVSFDIGTKERREAVMSLARARVRAGIHGFQRACRPGAVQAAGQHRNIWATHIKGWLSDDELKRANALLKQLIELLGTTVAKAVNGKRAYELTFILCPRALERVRL